MLDRFIVDGLFRAFGEYFVNKNPKISIYFIVAIIAILLIMKSSS
jgi:hypothetical protein